MALYSLHIFFFALLEHHPLKHSNSLHEHSHLIISFVSYYSLMSESHHVVHHRHQDLLVLVESYLDPSMTDVGA